jgi:hypothetical protein
MYEPNVNYTGINYDKSKLRSIEPGLFKIPLQTKHAGILMAPLFGNPSCECVD